MDDFEGPPAPKGSIVQQGLEAVVDEQRERIATLQSAADLAGWQLSREISMPTVDYAWAALNTYTWQWFANQIYSPKVLVAIARSLIEAAEAYTFLDTSVWEQIVKEKSK